MPEVYFLQVIKDSNYVEIDIEQYSTIIKERLNALLSFQLKSS